MLVGIVGLGYVGLTLAVALADRGVRVIGFDVDQVKISLIQSGKAPLFEKDLESLMNRVLANGLFEVTSDVRNLKEISHCVITVGTPLKGDSFDTSQIELVVSTLGKIVNREAVFCLRSTVGLGTCNKVRNLLIEVGHEGHVAMCPERTIEGFALKELRTLPQIIGAENEVSMGKAMELFSELKIQIITTNSFEVAELAKLACNAWRDLFFAFSNEVALIGEELSIDARQALAIAQEDYPRLKVAQPGPVGGPCLVKDGISLASSSLRRKERGSLFDLARRINEGVVDWAIEKVREATQVCDHKIKIGIIGLTFKSDPPTDDVRNSPSLDFIRKLSSVEDTWTFCGWDPQVNNIENLPIDELISRNGDNSLGEIFARCEIVTIWHKLDSKTREMTGEHINNFSGLLVLDLWSNFSKDEITINEYHAFGSGV